MKYHSLSEVYLHLALGAHADIYFSVGHAVVNLLHHICFVFLHLLRELYHLEKGVPHVVLDVEVRSSSNVFPVLLSFRLRNLRVLEVLAKRAELVCYLFRFVLVVLFGGIYQLLLQPRDGVLYRLYVYLRELVFDDVLLHVPYDLFSVSDDGDRVMVYRQE